MKILVLGDLHGKKPVIKFREYDAIICPGDFSSDTARKYIFEEIKKRIANPSYDKQWFEITGMTKAKEMSEKSFEEGREVLEYLDSLGKPVYAVPGNWDCMDYPFATSAGKCKKMFSGLSNVVDVHHCIYELGNFHIIGNGMSSGPESIGEYEEDFTILSLLFQRAYRPVIFLSHNMPFGTRLDRIRDKKSPLFGQHYGSVVARDIINIYQPLVFIGGHMHENMGKEKMGKTLCINSGAGQHANVLVEISGKTIRGVKMRKK